MFASHTGSYRAAQGVEDTQLEEEWEEEEEKKEKEEKEKRKL